jgi:multiple sugar transport system substrate-binding protein
MVVTRRRFTAGALAVVSALALVGCSSGGPAGGSAASFTAAPAGALKVWGFSGEDDERRARLAYAKKELDDVTVSVDHAPFDAAKFTTRQAAGNVPDLVQMDRQSVATYAAQGLILPLDRCFAAHQVDPESTYYPAVVDDVRYRGDVWAVPQYYSAPAIVTNRRVMAAAGVTDADIDTSRPDVLIAAVSKMYRASGGRPSVLGFDPQVHGHPDLWILAYGGRLIDAHGKPTLDDPRNLRGLEVVKAIADAQGGYARLRSFTDSFDFFGAKNQFVTDQVGAEVAHQWFGNVLTPYLGDIDVSAVPFRDSEGKPFAATTDDAFVIPAASRNKDAACAFALAATSLPAWEAAGAARHETIAKTPGAVDTGLFTGSPRADAVLREKYVKPSGNAGFDTAIATFYDVLPHGKSFGSSPAGQQIQVELQNVIQACLLGSKTPQQALREAQTSALRAYHQVTGT